MASGSLRVGGVTLAAEEALRRATRYVTSPPGAYAYPSYDTYQTDSGPATLADGDLLAPVLLNAAPTIEAYESLRTHRQILERALAALPGRDLADATDGDLTLISDLYRPLNPPGLAGVQGTTLSKVLHRKQPRLIPLYDRHILWCYRDAPDAPIKTDRHRHWPEFMGLLAAEIRDDLRRPGARELLDEIVALATRGSLTRLRAWDLIAWEAGRPDRRKAAFTGP